MIIDKSSFISIIIVNWNGKKYLKTCLSSLTKLSYPHNKVKIIIVDNASIDNSINWVCRNYPNVKIIANKTNLGFAKANNLGIEESLKNKDVSYIVTLNNDTEVDKDWLTYLVNFMETNRRVGIAVGKILQFKNRKLIDSTGDFFAKNTYRVINRGYNEKDNGQYNLPASILSACAAASIFRRFVLEDVKINNEFFDEDFISYLEDVDLNIRARLKGWECYYVPEAIIYHFGSATSSRISRDYKEYHSRKNRIFVAIKSFPLDRSIFLIFHYIFPSLRGFKFYFLERLNYRFKRGIKYYFKRKRKNRELNLLRAIKHYMSITSKLNLRLTLLEVSCINMKALLKVLILLPIMIKKRTKIQNSRFISDNDVNKWFSQFIIPDK